MAKTKLDWDKMKQEFIESDIVVITDFLRTKHGLENKSYYRTKTKGWQEAKNKYRATLVSEVNKKISKNIDVKDQINYIITAMKNTEMKVAKLLGQKETEFTIEDLPKIKVGYEILRLATGQSTVNQSNDDDSFTIHIVNKNINKEKNIIDVDGN